MKITKRACICTVSVMEGVSKKDGSGTYNRVELVLPEGYTYSSFLRGNENIALRKVIETYDIGKHAESLGQDANKLYRE